MPLKIEVNSVSILMGNVRESLQVRYKRKKIIESRYLSDKITMVVHIVEYMQQIRKGETQLIRGREGDHGIQDKAEKIPMH